MESSSRREKVRLSLTLNEELVIQLRVEFHTADETPLCKPPRRKKVTIKNVPFCILYRILRADITVHGAAIDASPEFLAYSIQVFSLEYLAEQAACRIFPKYRPWPCPYGIFTICIGYGKAIDSHGISFLPTSGFGRQLSVGKVSIVNDCLHLTKKPRKYNAVCLTIKVIVKLKITIANKQGRK